jgi:pimeloyl-ACP methyl ester carboxylesterase
MPRYCTAFLALLIAAPAFALEPFPSSFHTQEINTNGTTLHVRIGGEGPAVIMLHGFGDTVDMWAPAAEVLVKQYRVVVPDLRGMGLSAHPDTGYTKKNQALDIVGVMDALKIESACLVTHDIGDMVGYALAAQYPSRITKWVVIDAPLPGIGHWDEIKQSPLLWHFNFRGPDEERLVAGRERIYLDRFYDELSADPKKIDEATRRHYAALYALLASVPPLMLKTDKNPEGTPMEVFDSFRKALAANRAQFFLDVPTGPFYGFNRPGAKPSQGIIQNWWRQGMMGSALAHYEGIKALSETDQTDDLKAITVPTLVMQGDDDQVVPYKDASLLQAKLLKHATLKIYPGYPHGLMTTHAEVINADLLAFIKS